MKADRELTCQRAVIEQIRTERYLLDIDGESERVKLGARNLQEQLNSTLELLSKDLYSRKSHFILELIQNADDNEYAEGAVPQLTFRLVPGRLILLNNETGFSERHVHALCSVGRSSKAKKSGYIGEKGIGFKSVFAVSNAPEIHSNGYHFRFDRRDEANLLGYVVPEWCEAPEDADPSVTAIVLPAADGYEFRKEMLDDLDARVLLFLSKLREIDLLSGSERTRFSRREKDGLSVLSTEIAAPGTVPSVEESRFVRVSIDVSMENVRDEKRPDISATSIVLAFPVDASGAAEPQPASHVFAFLPIRQVGFKFSIQADFILSSSREDILTDRGWNKRLRDGIAVAFTEAVSRFQASDALAFSYLRYLPAEGDISDPFFHTLTESIVTRLAQTKCIPSEGGQWKSPSELRIAEKWFKELFPPSVAMQLFGFDYVDQRVLGVSDQLRRLGAKHISFADVLDIFRSHGDWLKMQSIEWKARFYARLAELDLQKLVPGLVKLPCIPTNGGDLVVPSSSHVFYPLSRRRKFGFEHELVIVDGDLLDKAQTHSLKVQALFAALQVKSDDPYDLVTSHILPRHQGDAWKTSENRALLGHLRYIKDKLQEYLQGAAARGQTEPQALQTLRDGVWLETKKRGDLWLFSKPNQLYLSKEYAPKFCMETLLGEAIESSLLVSAEYLPVKPKSPDAEAESWREFLIRLGVRVAPRLEAVGNGDTRCSAELQSLLGSQQSSVRKATLQCLNRNWTEYADHLKFPLHTGRSVTHRETQFARSLRSMLAPTRKRASTPISEVFYASSELRELFGDRLTYIDAELSPEVLDACGVTYRLDASACLKRLRQLKAEGGDTIPQLQALYRHLEQFWAKDGAAIKQAFFSDGLIRVRGTHAAWAMPSEVAWRSSGPFLDSLYPPLQGQYRDFSGFFNEKLGVPKELPTERLLEALRELGRIELIDERRREALAIYKRANRELMPRFGRDEVPTPSWLRVFGDSVFLNHRGELVSSQEPLFANDAPEFETLFCDEVGISFLAVPSEEVPRLARLLDATGVPRLSSSVIVELVEASDGKLEADLTSRIRRAIPYLGRVMYAKSHALLEGAAERGLLKQLYDIEVIEVPELMLAVTLAQVSRKTTADIARGEGRIFIRSGARSIKDQIASELCKMLEAPLDLADTFARVLMEEDADSVEDFLRVRRFGQLPADLLAMLADDYGGQHSHHERDEAEAAAALDSEHVEAQFAEPLASFTAADPSVVAELPEPRISSGHTGANRVGNSAPHGEVGTGRCAPSIVPDGASRPDAASDDSRSHPSSRRPEQHPEGQVSSAQHGGVIGSGSDGRAHRSMDATEDNHRQDRPRSPHDDVVPLPQIGSSDEVPTRGAKSKRSQKRRHRTKAGRLLSYAAAPGEGEREEEDDPAKAAARVALGKGAVDYFLATQTARWQSLTPMPHNNPGFDVRAIAQDGTEEFIEVKGQSSAWTEHGVALTPTELMSAQKHRHRYWLCVVEHLYDEKRRALYLDVPPVLSSTANWSPIPQSEEIGREEALFRRADHRLPARGRGRTAGQGAVPQARLQRGVVLPLAEQVRRHERARCQAPEGA